MNDGNFGQDLSDILKYTYTSDKLAKAADSLRPILAEQGLMGVYYLDPSIYASCDEGANRLRAKGIKYVKAMKSCAGCIANDNDFCAKYAKPVVTTVPYKKRF
jgi:hypothetical protein